MYSLRSSRVTTMGRPPYAGVDPEDARNLRSGVDQDVDVAFSGQSGQRHVGSHHWSATAVVTDDHRIISGGSGSR